MLEQLDSTHLARDDSPIPVTFISILWALSALVFRAWWRGTGHEASGEAQRERAINQRGPDYTFLLVTSGYQFKKRN